MSALIFDWHDEQDLSSLLEKLKEGRSGEARSAALDVVIGADLVYSSTAVRPVSKARRPPCQNVAGNCPR